MTSSALSNYSNRLQAASARVEELNRRFANVSDQSPELVRKLLFELRTAMEELSVAEAELSQQNEELGVASLALEAERQRYAELFEFAPDAYLITDPQTHILESNRAAARLLDDEFGSLAGRLLVTRVPVDDRRCFRVKLIRLLEEHTGEWDGTLCRRDESIRDVNFKATAIFSAQGDVIGLRWLVRDITARKRAETEAADLKTRLEERVRDRTRELEEANRQKAVLLDLERAAHEEAENANKYKDQFIATVSHELRTPLSVILGWVKLLEDETLDAEKLRQGLGTIERNAKLQTQIVNDLLDMSRINSGKLKIDLKPVNVASVCELAVESVRESAEAKEHVLVAEWDRDGPTVQGDAVRLQQVVMNLISNAIQFSPRGGRIAVTLSYEGEYAWIMVSDHGQGMTAEFLPHAFDRFRQADGQTTRRQSGLGLGLPIVRHLVELHGGSIHLHSPGPGLGTTAVVLLPIGEEARPVAESASGTSPCPSKKALNGLKVLVVDDQPDSRQVLAGILHLYGATVCTAESAAAVLKLLQEWRPDVLISDIAMPDTDGYTLIRQVRSLPAELGGETPAIAFSAFARPQDRDNALAAGFHAHLGKPVDSRTLVSAILALCGGGEPLDRVDAAVEA